MNLFAFLIGITLPALLGWAVLLLLERDHPVLGRTERMVWSLILGPTLFVLIAFVPHVLGLTRLNLVGFLVPAIVIFAIVLVLAVHQNALSVHAHIPASVPARSSLPRFVSIGILLLCVWTAVKMASGAYDLVSVPTYWDDSFNNWNMRGKVFFVTEELQLTIPVGNGVVQSAEGVGSYPPSLPLLKTWLSVLRGSWEEPLVNGVHLIWIVGLAGAFSFTLRRKFPVLPSLGGVYLLLSLPLLMIQGTNPYAEVMVASHVFLAVSCLYFLAQASEEKTLRTWLKLFAFSLGLMIFTKNEASVLYAPILLLICAWILRMKVKATVITHERLRSLLLRSILLAVVLAAPWITFKWLNGLTFGNAKSVSGMQLSFHALVLPSIWYHLTHEANWLLLPLLITLLIVVSGKHAFRLPEGVLTVFVLASVCAQFLIFTFTPLATEALRQTGLSRGLLHIAPVGLLLVILLAEQLLQEKSEENQESRMKNQAMLPHE